ncbi:hypothetical protein IFM89_022178 [Coptis chinensis]|uniref:S-acyltransferase n=1 Tax=Coptis chinensis TaxID=261450 RepID=A0A835GZ78_9MAGN|nr:hypothetical protein IFM89_022178 [Coptis chinensis]
MASINHKQEPSAKDLEIKGMLPVSNKPDIELLVDDQGSLQIKNLDNPIGLLEPEQILSENAEKFEAFDNPILGCKRFIRDRITLYRNRKETTRMYHVWPGKNVFFFGGRLVCGPDPRGFILTTISIVLSSWIFCIYIGYDLKKHSGLVVALAVALTIDVLVNLIMVSAIDPGIIPRNDKISVDGVGSSDGSDSKRVRVNGVEVKLKFCRICKIFRPPRSCHCAICDNCVEKFDHHCPWIGQCIGQRNYRFYLMFVLSALIFFIYIFSFSCRRTVQKMLETKTGLFKTLGNCPETLALASFSFVAMWFLGGLVSFHTYLIMQNQTAYENYRQYHIGSPNPYDKGILSNMKEVFFTRLPPSRVDFRAEMTPETCSEDAKLEHHRTILLNRVNAMKLVEGKHVNKETGDLALTDSDGEHLIEIKSENI